MRPEKQNKLEISEEEYPHFLALGQVFDNYPKVVEALRFYLNRKMEAINDNFGVHEHSLEFLLVMQGANDSKLTVMEIIEGLIDQLPKDYEIYKKHQK